MNFISFIQRTSPPAPPDADPRSDRPRCGGRESKFLAVAVISDGKSKFVRFLRFGEIAGDAGISRVTQSVPSVFQKCLQRRGPAKGFTLVICLVLMVPVVILAVSLMTLAGVELRKVSNLHPAATARANARLALMQAIGQLQRTMGPDQRVSATADILRKEVTQPRWTGVWKSTLANGDPVFTRDDLNGGLRDERWEKKINPADQVMEWLVSGNGDPTLAGNEDQLTIYQENPADVVKVPKVTLTGGSGKTAGHIAWWTGDLGVRANLNTTDPRANLLADRSKPGDGGLYRILASQSADLKMMDQGVDLQNSVQQRIVSAKSMALSGTPKDWEKAHAFDFTTASSGVLADVANGGLKMDLTSYFEKGPAAPYMNLEGLADDDLLVGEKRGGRYGNSSPRFGLLRDWATLSVPFAGNDVAARTPDFDASAGKDSSTRALANELPVKLVGNKRTALQPILVEATNFTQMSAYQDKVDRNTSYKTFQIRQLMYPRVVLWNPYNVNLKFDRSVIMIQGNGRQEMWTANSNVNGIGNSPLESQWVNFEGGRSTVFASWPFLFNSEGYNDPYMGSYYFTIPETTFAPGECLVFSPDKCREYDGLSVYRPGSYDLSNNLLSCQVSPDPSRSYYVSASDIDGGINFLPTQFWYKPSTFLVNGSVGVANQSDDARSILKKIVGSGPVSFESFDKLPQTCVLSASLQYGGGREPRVSWSTYERMPMQLLDKNSPQPTVIPNVRTREGIRLRWFDEHRSNTGSGSLAGTPYFQDSLLGNWNPRASFIVRSPWENIGGIAPWFFGAYTRDLYDQAVSWDDQVPVPKNGRFHGNPFGPPQEGNGKYVLFDVPRTETGLLSLGQLQHAKLSELVWHPSYALGNSLVDPRLGTGGVRGLNRTAAVATDATAAKKGGFYQNEIGWSNDTQRSSSKDDWASTARAILAQVPETDNLVYDLSFEVNQKLWDRFYLSSGSTAQKLAFIDDPAGHPLPNGRMRLVTSDKSASAGESLTHFHKAASVLQVDGAFNVNSTSVEAWKALLGSTRRTGFGSSDKVPFPRVLNPPGGAWKNGDPAFSENVWSGYRELGSDEIGRLAVAIVAEIKARGPFISMADFVNRRLAEDETGRMGALQAAIEKAGLNSTLTKAYPLENNVSLPNYKHPDNITDATRMEQMLKPASKAWGAPVYLTQADVLQVLAPTLTARSDTFVIRAYGDAVDAAGNTVARAWCEAVVQRNPHPLSPDDSGLNSNRAGKSNDFGREFTITSFRWLLPNEV